MEYPKIKENLTKQVNDLEKKLESTRGQLGRALIVLGKHMESIEKKASGLEPEDFKHYMELMEENPKGAEEFLLSKEIAKRAIELKNKKSQQVDETRKKIEALELEKGKILYDFTRLDRFAPVQEQLDNPEFKENFEISDKPVVWPNSPWDIASKLYGPRDKDGNRMQIQPRADGKYAATPKQQIPVEPCPLDPNRLQDWMLEDLGLAEFPIGIGETESLVRKIGALPDLKKVFSKAKPMVREDQSHRMIPNYRLLVTQGLTPDQNGKIIHTFHHGGEHDKKVPQVHDNLYTLYRKTLHVESGYEDEATVINKSERRIPDLHQKFLMIKKGDQDEAEKKNEIRNALADEAKRLYLCRNRFKRAAREALDSIKDLKDGLGRENVGAARARLLRVIKFVKSRSPEIFSKAQFTQEDKLYLKSTLDQNETLFDGLFEKCVEIYQRLNQSQKDAAPENTPARQIGYVRGALLEPLRSVATVRPFSLYAGHMEAHLGNFIDQIKAGDREGMRFSVKKTLAILQIFKIQKQIERLIFALSGVQEPNFRAISRTVTPLLNWIVEMARNPQPESLLAVYPEAIRMISANLEGFTTMLGDYAKGELNAEDTEEARAQLKLALESIDFADLLQTL